MTSVDTVFRFHVYLKPSKKVKNLQTFHLSNMLIPLMSQVLTAALSHCLRFFFFFFEIVDDIKNLLVTDNA